MSRGRYLFNGADDQETLDIAAKAAGTMIYATGTYGFYGYAYANLGENYQFVYT
jgi:ubiquitin-like 1-activating enzyme E1 A